MVIKVDKSFYKSALSMLQHSVYQTHNHAITSLAKA